MLVNLFKFNLEHQTNLNPTTSMSGEVSNCFFVMANTKYLELFLDQLIEFVLLVLSNQQRCLEEATDQNTHANDSTDAENDEFFAV